MVTKVKMVRPVEKSNGGPTEALVHPNDVSSCYARGWRLLTEVESAVEDAETSKVDAPEEEEEGSYTLLDAVQKCRSNAALEEIVESNDIAIDLEEYDTFADKKDAVLEILE